MRELILEVSRRLPTGPDSPATLDPSALDSAAGCREACGALLGWLDGAPGPLATAVAELERVFVSLLGTVQEIDTRLHRAVLQTRSWIGEEVAFSHALGGVLQELDDSTPADLSLGPTLLSKIIRQIEAKERRDEGEALSLSAHFEGVQEGLHGLRERVSRIERETRRWLDESRHDSLTGLGNRRAYEARVGDEVSRAFRYGSPLSLVIWDVDHFKEVNVEHGHRVGDAVLRELTDRILKVMRRSDHVTRYGGQTFVALLPNTASAQASTVAAKIRSAIEAAPFQIPAGALRVTASVGVASLQLGDDPQVLLERADRALSRAKAGGRNRVEVDDT